MSKETELSVIIALLMKKLGLTEYTITAEMIDELKSDKKYVGFKAYKQNNSIVVKRTTREDYKLEDLLDIFMKALKNDK